MHNCKNGYQAHGNSHCNMPGEEVELSGSTADHWLAENGADKAGDTNDVSALRWRQEEFIGAGIEIVKHVIGIHHNCIQSSHLIKESEHKREPGCLAVFFVEKCILEGHLIILNFNIRLDAHVNFSWLLALVIDACDEG